MSSCKGLNIFIFSYIGALHLYFGWDEYRVEVGITELLITEVCFFSAVAMLGLMLGFKGGGFIWGWKSKHKKYFGIKSGIWWRAGLVSDIGGILFFYFEFIPTKTSRNWNH